MLSSNINIFVFILSNDTYKLCYDIKPILKHVHIIYKSPKHSKSSKL